MPVETSFTSSRSTGKIIIFMQNKVRDFMVKSFYESVVEPRLFLGCITLYINV